MIRIFLLSCLVLYFCVAYSHAASAKNVKLNTAKCEACLKIVDTAYYYYMKRPEVITYIKRAAKLHGKDYSILVKKMNGVCFDAINLNKVIDDKEISAMQALLRSTIIPMAMQEGKLLVQYKKDSQYISQIQVEGTVQKDFVASSHNNIIYKN